MIVSTYYNSVNKCLTFSWISENETVVNVKEEGKTIHLLNDEDQVVGINYFLEDSTLKSGLHNAKEYINILNELFSEIENPFVIGFVKSCVDHPKSEKLKICQVELGEQTVQIVCGASNVKENIKVIVAKVGAIMPNGQKIIAGKLLDVESNGMICSLSELQRGEPNRGIAIIEEQELYIDYI